MSEGIQVEEKEERGLQSLSLKVSYNSGDYDLLNEFYIPCLKHANRYDRAAGYFDSKSLTLAAQGISELILNDGRMRLIASPRLSPQDIEVLEKIANDEEVDREESDVIESALHQGTSAEQFSDFLERDRFKCMAWMLEEGLLDIRIAYLRDADESNPFSHYHEKIGVFTDRFGNKAAFSGSINETELGWTDNYESFNVYPNWRTGLDMLASEKQEHFQKLWDNEDPRVIVKELPEAVQKGLEEHSPGTVNGKPELERFQEDDAIGSTAAKEQDIPLWEHQQEAIDAWISNNYRGIFAMATGTGKTWAAISAANLDADNRLTLVVVPGSTLLNQWRDNIEELIPDADVVVCSSDTKWDKRILDVTSPYKLGEPKFIQDKPNQFVVTTIQTAIGEAFQSFVRDISPDYIQVVADEVHRYGADTFQRLFEIDAGRRVGLSATPKRRFDDKGNEEIINYFDDIIFRFETAEAIQNGYLSEYNYHPLICELDSEEYEQYKKYSQMIATVHQNLKSGNVNNRRELKEKDKRLKRDRAKILALLIPDSLWRFHR